MHSSSSELLLDQQQELLRKKKLLELAAKLEPQKPKRKTCKQRIRFYTTSFLAMAVSTGSAALLFLVPLYVDPAVSTLMSEFIDEPVICETIQVEHLIGLGNCTWSSCREGCTSDMYKCTHITVQYQPNNSTTDIKIEATLLVNIKGCGYPPTIRCSNFWNNYGHEGLKYPCHYSIKNSSLVMPTYTKTEHINTIINFFFIPFIITTIASIALCVMHCDCQCKRVTNNNNNSNSNKNSIKKKEKNDTEDISEVTISRIDTARDEEELRIKPL